jgi:hypothetical protein
MKKRSVLAGLFAAIMVIAAGCESPSGKADAVPSQSDTKTFTGTGGGKTYTLAIRDNTTYALTVLPDNKKSAGTVTASAEGVYTLKPSNSGPAFTVTASGGSISHITGTITFDDNTTMDAPATVTPTPPSVPPDGEEEDEEEEEEVISVGETIGPLSLDDLSPGLAGLAANTAAKPYLLKLDSSVVIDTGDYSGELNGLSYTYSGVWATINRAVGRSGKYVILDLGACSARNNRIDGGYNAYSTPSGCEMNIIRNNQFIKGIILPAGLTRIGTRAFHFCEYLSILTIPAQVTGIGESAFLGCDGLAQVTVPAALADDFNDHYTTTSGASARLNVVLTGPGSLAEDAFDDVRELVGITIGEGVTGVSADAFDHCVNLAAVHVDEANEDYSSVDGVLFSKDKTVLYYYPKARTGSYSIPPSVKGIARKAFAECTGLTGITLPSGLEIIGTDAFYNCAPAFTGELALPDGLTEIYPGAFYNCTGITSLNIPESVTSLGGYRLDSSSSGSIVTFHWNYGAFDQCSGLTALTIPVGLTGNFANKFSGYSNLALTLTGEGAVPDRAFAGIYRTFDNKEYDCAGITSIVIGNDVTGVGERAFSGCSGLTGITVGTGVSLFYSNSFDGCDNLERITIAPGNPTYFSEQNVWYNGVRGTVAFVPRAIRGSITIPQGITTIGDSAFAGRAGLTGVNIPYSVVVIGERAFAGCTGLNSVTIPNSLNAWLMISDNLGKPVSFDDIPQALLNTIDAVYIDGVSTIKPYAFDGCTNLTSVTFEGGAIIDHDKYETQKLWDAIIMFVCLFLPIPEEIAWIGQIDTVYDGLGLVADAKNNSLGAEYEIGFYNNAFPEGSAGAGGNALKTQYLAGGAGTYTRSENGTTWTKQ